MFARCISEFAPGRKSPLKIGRLYYSVFSIPFFKHKRVLLYLEILRKMGVIAGSANKLAVKVGEKMVRLFACDERGVVTVDWVALTAGILLLGIMVIFSVMGNSANYLIGEFEVLNSEIESLRADVSELGAQIDFNP